MKILFINDILEGGGAERSMATLISTLHQRFGLEIQLALLEKGLGFPLPAAVKIHFLSQEKKPSNLKKLAGLVIQAKRVLQLVNQEDIDLVISFQFRSNFTNVISKILGNPAPIIISERAYAKDFYNRPGLAPVLNQFLIRKLYPKANHIIVNSSDIAQGLSHYYGIPTGIQTVINNGYDKKAISKESEQHCNEWETLFGPDDIVLVSVGRVEWEKGQEYLIQVLAKLKKEGRYKLLLLGLVRTEYQRKLDELADRLGVRDRVVYQGFVDNPYKWIARSQIFVFASLFEGYPNALAEAVILRKPVVSFDIKAGVSDIIQSERQGFKVPFGDVEAMSQAVELALGLKILSDQHILNSSQSAGKYYELFQKILNG